MRCMRVLYVTVKGLSCLLEGRARGSSLDFRCKIEDGYVLPFYNEPEPYTCPNKKSAVIERDFANGDLRAGGYIKVAREVPHVCSPLSVLTNQSEKKRLVVNLRHVNRSLGKQKFKYEDLMVIMLFGPGEWMFSFDLKSGYHHIGVFLGWCVLQLWYCQLDCLWHLMYSLRSSMRPLVKLWCGVGRA